MPCCGIIIMCSLVPPFKFHEQRGALEAIRLRLSPETWSRNKTAMCKSTVSIPEADGIPCAPTKALPLPKLPGKWQMSPAAGRRLGI